MYMSYREKKTVHCKVAELEITQYIAESFICNVTTYDVIRCVLCRI